MYHDLCELTLIHTYHTYAHKSNEFIFYMYRVKYLNVRVIFLLEKNDLLVHKIKLNDAISNTIRLELS